eukprot:CAMPEP_0206459500 /NCGR_PEP_ID=MMETSP0324_2-20121206/24208_1 /ASSEMBLY_ACC=CAM_ASM_000836 /TAXON_ID=2866 /ORGANISM="Crypthecodinium cohnii, Strain Seligo" /LENGTH=43 /DNA_ID= /DNA_START= /DNA_END= /DNA_ORIENTATION=
MSSALPSAISNVSVDPGAASGGTIMEIVTGSEDAALLLLLLLL